MRERVPNNPKPEADLPDCPEWLTNPAKKIWKETAPQLHAMGVLTRIDADAFAAYCVTLDQWQTAARAIASSTTFVADNGNYVARPEVAIFFTALRSLNQLRDLFGMTPFGRTKIDIKRQTAAASDFDKLTAEADQRRPN